MFRRKKNSSRDSAVSRDSFAVSRDSSAVASPSALSDAGSGMNTSGLFLSEYRSDHARADNPAPQAPAVHTSTAPARSHYAVANGHPKEMYSHRMPMNSLPPKYEVRSNELDQQNKLLAARLAELKGKRNALLHETKAEEAETKRFEGHVELLRQRLAEVNHGLAEDRHRCATLDKVIEETEAGYIKLVETSKMILGLLESDAKY